MSGPQESGKKSQPNCSGALVHLLSTRGPLPVPSIGGRIHRNAVLVRTAKRPWVRLDGFPPCL
jgi:hypothetical protein